jgi:AraC family transcriptional regulator
MSRAAAKAVDFSEPAATSSLLPRPPIRSSYAAGWQQIYLQQFQLPAWEISEIACSQQTLVIVTPDRTLDVEFSTAGKKRALRFDRTHHDCISLIPAYLPNRSNWQQEAIFTVCHLEPNFIARVAHESIDPDRVELQLALQRPDPLIWQICRSLNQILATAATNSCFYAESMATALAAQLVQFYATRQHLLREYPDGLPRAKLKQAIEYINEHLSEDISLGKIATELDISHYYLCKLFKQSLGMTPHAYLVQQRVERSIGLLQRRESRIIDIALACGFANPSHFARCFRRQMGISPKQFRLK